MKRTTHHHHHHDSVSAATAAQTMNVASVRRNLKNFAHNYSDAQKKVREATSNDPWGPSSSIMADVADLTYNVVAFSEIMQMVWKRLNDHGRNWRHVYKALVLLEYLIKTGSEKVGQQCKENIFAIQTLRDFQYVEEGKDQGQNVREKAKQLVALLKDDERLRNERARALKAKERFARTASGFGSDSIGASCGSDGDESSGRISPRYPAFGGSGGRGEWSSNRDSADAPRPDIEQARPQTAGEEELQLQLALAMSREEHEQEEQKRKSDDVRLQLALSQSQQDFKTTTQDPRPIVDLLDVNLNDNVVDPWGMPQQRPQDSSSPWRSPPTVDPWGVPPKSQDPWEQPGVPHHNRPVRSPLDELDDDDDENVEDPWSPTSNGAGRRGANLSDLDEFDVITNRNRNGTESSVLGGDPFELNLLGDSLPTQPDKLDNTKSAADATAKKRTPLSFLGENSALVNLDNLVTIGNTAKPQSAGNPFSSSSSPTPTQQQQQQPKQPSINEIKRTQQFPNQPLFNNGQQHFNIDNQLYPNLQQQQQQRTISNNLDPWSVVVAPSTNKTANNDPWSVAGAGAASSGRNENPFLS